MLEKKNQFNITYMYRIYFSIINIKSKYPLAAIDFNMRICGERCQLAKTWGCILERVKILIFEIIVVFTIISNVKILSSRLSVSAILEIFKMRLSVTLKLRQLPTCPNFYDEL